MAAEYARLQSADQIIQRNRDSLNAELVKLQIQNGIIQHEKDSISILKEKSEKELRLLIRRHEAEIDSLTSKLIPYDSLYSRLQPIYPNINKEPLLYPFSGIQVRQIYGIAVAYPRMQKEYTSQTNLLQLSTSLNKIYKDSEKNYKDQVENLRSNISSCNEQLKNKDQQIKISQKQLKNKNFWNWTYKAAVLVIGGVAIFK
jgi:hypothetical protein